MAGMASDSALVPVAERERFEQDGYLIIRGALTHDEVLYYRQALDRAYLSAEAESLVAPGGPLHWLSTVARPFRFEWHQDGGRQNREVETDPRPRMSVKLAYWLSDVSEPGRGNLKVVPGSHLTSWIPGPPRRDVVWPDPDGAVEVTAAPGDVVLFDRRLWHARSGNYSTFTRKAIFFGYTYRWIAIRDENDGVWATDWASQLSPVQRQLLGGLQPGDGDHAWGHFPATIPLYGWLRERDLLDPAYPPLRP